MNRRRQRALSLFFLSALLLLFCGKALLSVCVQRVIQKSTGALFSFQELFIENGALVLKRARLSKCRSYEIDAERIAIGLWIRPFEILFDRPHFVLQEQAKTLFDRSNLSAKSRFFFHIQDGTFELQGKDPIQGALSYCDQEAHLEVKEGRCDVSIQSRHHQESRLQCSLTHFPIRLLSFFVESRFLDPLEGTADGVVHLGKSSISGHVRLSNAQFFLEERGLHTGAERIDLDGKALFNEKRVDIQRAKVSLHRGFVQRKGTLLEKIDGRFFANAGIGYRWELQGSDFSWEGKTFYREGQTGWIDSSLCYLGSSISLKMDLEKEGEKGLCSIKRGNPSLFSMLFDMGLSKEPAFVLNRGTLHCDFSWKSSEQSLVSWEISSFDGYDLELASQEGAIFQGTLEGFASSQSMKRSAIDGAFFLKNGAIACRGWLLNDLQMHAKIDKGNIADGSALFHLNGLDAKAITSGTLDELDLQIHLKGKWAHLLELAGLGPSCHPFSEEIEGSSSVRGDWDRFSAKMDLPFPEGGSLKGEALVERSGFSWKVAKGSMRASQFNLMRIQAPCFTRSSGSVDVDASYFQDKLQAEISGRQIRLENEQASLSFVELSSCKVSGNRGGWEAFLQEAQGEFCYGEDKFLFCSDLSLENELLLANIHSAEGAGLQFSGQLQCSLFDSDLPFSFQTSSLEGRCKRLSELLGFDCDGALEESSFFIQGSWVQDLPSWYWSAELHLREACIESIEHLHADLHADSLFGLIECSNLFGELVVQKARIGIRGRIDRDLKDHWLFDFHLEDRFCDLARVCGNAAQKEESLFFELDEKKSHFLGSKLHLRDCVGSKRAMKSAKLSLTFNRKDLDAAQNCLKKINPCFDSFFQAPLTGACSFELDWSSEHPSTLSFKGDSLAYSDQPLSLEVRLTKKNKGWLLDPFRIGSIEANGFITRKEGRWRIDEGAISDGQGLKSRFSGSIGPLFECELAMKELNVDLEHYKLGLQDPLKGTVIGKGYASVGWKDRLEFEIDLDLKAPRVDWAEFHIENRESVQLHFSKRQGLLMRGLDLYVQRKQEENSLRARIGLMQYDFEQGRFILHHSQLRVPRSYVSLCTEKWNPNRSFPSFLADLDSTQEIECSAEISFAKDFSYISCMMKEGLIPFANEIRHLQNAALFYDTEKLLLDCTAIHQGHGVKIALELLLDPMSGTLRLADMEKPLLEEERPMTIRWQHDPQKALVLHSIDGTFGGVEASFHKEVENLEKTSLIGTAKLDLAALSDLLPERVARVFKELKMGKNYELKGRLYQGAKGLADASFKGLLSGKNCELFGWQVRSLLAQIEADASLIRLFEIKGSDPAGILKIDEIAMSQTLEEPWRISMPDFRLVEFRPSLLKKSGAKAGPVGPLVVRELKIVDFKGLLEDSSTYSATGDLTFINSFKREHSVLDIPADVLGRIFGLDLELLIPVQGRLTFDLKEGKFWLQELLDAYSEGKRSKFFLLKEDTALPSVDLDGNIDILVKMKQYVLFKFTENFLLSIGGTLQDPSYSLQKKSRIQKLSR